MKGLIALAFVMSLAYAEKQPVTISEVSVVDGPRLSFEFTVTGPFFEEHKMEELTIRGIPSDEIGDYWLYLNWERGSLQSAPKSPKAFAYGSNFLEFYRDGELIHAENDYEETTTPSDVCIDPGSGRLRLTFNMWSGGATTPSRDVVFYFVPGKGIVSTTFAWHVQGVTTVDCAEGETGWEWGSSFHPCRCAGRIDGEDFFSATSDIRSAETIPDPISESDFCSLLSRIDRWQPVLERLERTALEIQHFESSRFEVVAITYDDCGKMYGSSQTIFVRRVEDGDWVRVYVAPESPKGFWKATIHGFVSEEVLDLTIVDHPEPYWGNYERVRKNIREWWSEAQ